MRSITNDGEAVEWLLHFLYNAWEQFTSSYNPLCSTFMALCHAVNEMNQPYASSEYGINSVIKALKIQNERWKIIMNKHVSYEKRLSTTLCNAITICLTLYYHPKKNNPSTFRCIQKHKFSPYFNLLIRGKLKGCFADANRQTEEISSHLVKQVAEHDGITEKLKAENQME